MAFIWTYPLMALCLAVTSARVVDFPGNRNSFQDDPARGFEGEKVLAPPTDGDLIIDSTGFPGNSNEPMLENMFGDIVSALFSQNPDSAKFEIIPFGKEDFSILENSDLCKTMCSSGAEKSPCRCN